MAENLILIRPEEAENIIKSKNKPLRRMAIVVKDGTAYVSELEFVEETKGEEVKADGSAG